MKRAMRVIVLAVAALSIASLATAGIILDDFNRSNGAVGSNWTIRAGSFAISSNNLRTTSSESLMTFNGLVSDTASVDALHVDSGLYYAAIVLGYADIDHNIFVKVQSQSALGNDYNYVGFYYGNNGGGSFFSITPFTSGRITANLAGDSATLWIDTNFDNLPDFTYQHTYSAGQIAGLGTGVGLAGYAPGLMDNFGVPGNPVPEPGALLLLATGLVGVGRAWRKRQP